PARAEAHTTATGHVPQHPQARARDNAGPARPRQPAQYGAARTAAAPRPAGGSRTRAAAQPAPPRTRGRLQPADPTTPRTGHSARADEPLTCPLRHAVFGIVVRGTGGWNRVTVRSKRWSAPARK